MLRAVRAAGEVIIENYGKVSFDLKQDSSFVSGVDRQAESIIKNILSNDFPNYGFVGEEFGNTNARARYKWVVDPLDGTTNYKIMVPFFNVSIALAKDNAIIAGVVYNPVTREVFWAEKGKGSYLNNEPIRVSQCKELKEAVLGYCHGRAKEDIKLALLIHNKLKLKSHIRQFGAAALELAYVASGRLGGFLMAGVNPWDVAAGSLLVLEAGGKVTEFNGSEFKLNSNTILATNSSLHKILLEAINEAIHQKDY